jgi:fructose-bisphosphate aldolase/2-amino-3,7-dideoxy-D-threo-hept-6-ulosonate synthase
MLGKRIRLERILDRETGRSVVVPMDHGVTVGPIPGIEDMRQMVNAMAEGGANAVLGHMGLPLYGHRHYGKDIGLILHLSGSTVWSPDPNAKVLVNTVENAVRNGADAVSVHVNIGAANEADMLRDLGTISVKCMEWGMPLLAMMYTRGEKFQTETGVEGVKHAARIAAELGADIVKVSYTGGPESFVEVVRGCPIPILIAGGEKRAEDREMFEAVRGALEAGGAGVSIGRNAFQHQRPERFVRAVCALVHENVSVERALEIVREGGKP